ncbi:GNAT family N-acetyltransferase [Spiractinospora alimapuensis]|uniref:GNAT family N-acetyltransferase n=1 Tax=Spiractinospora alimapuensis TaxID=2820884 RepID=UPI001F296977|nr:GNAT family N-acetyltransferase [Spiractinospora alimapuensis]QVQ53070.1 GNAT family N-acetyltransferase [Spiractinospora alimapuensis]
MSQPPRRSDVSTRLPETVVDPVEPEDVGEVWTLMRAAFVDEAQFFGDPFILPLTESQGQVRQQLDRGAILLKATHGSRIVGTVRGVAQDATFLVSRLAVAPDRRQRGVGRKLMEELEWRVRDQYPRVASLASFVAPVCDARRALYRGLGYSEVSTERAADHLSLVQMRKSLPSA